MTAVRRQTNLFSEARSEAPEPLPVPARALTVGAHPDDAEFGAGGTITKWAAAGCEVSMLILTDGSKGTWDPGVSPQELAASRREEQRRAADLMGVTGELVFLRHVDGELEHSMALREEMALWIRRLKPDVVLGWDPWKRYMMHPDHRAAGWAVVDGVVDARDHLFHSHQLINGLTKHRPEALLLYGADEPDYWEDVTETFDRKIEALLCHSSQTSTTMSGAGGPGQGRQEFTERIRKWCAKMGEPAGMELAEAFKLLRP